MSKSILVVEDDANIQELIVEFLRAEDYNVDYASDGLEGIKLFKKNDYDLIILDIMMPNLDGYSACKMIRKTSSVPIIFLTALNQENDEVKGFELECDDYITKPFSFNLLIKRVEAVLRRSNTTAESNDYLSFGKLRLDLNTYTVNVDGNIVELTLKEFNILKNLIEKYPQVITRESLLDSIWGYDYYGDTRIVDAHIKNIRKKIELPYIKTVKGIGYTLEKIYLDKWENLSIKYKLFGITSGLLIALALIIYLILYYLLPSYYHKYKIESLHEEISILIEKAAYHDTKELENNLYDIAKKQNLAILLSDTSGRIVYGNNEILLFKFDKYQSKIS